MKKKTPSAHAGEVILDILDVLDEETIRAANACRMGYNTEQEKRKVLAVYARLRGMVKP